jgi:hypothetical protein
MTPSKFYSITLLSLSTTLHAGTVIQFGGDTSIIGDSSYQSQIGADQIISWTGANSSGGGVNASGIMGGTGGQSPGATLTSLGSETVTMTSVTVTGGTGTYSSGTPNVLGVGPTTAAAKFDTSGNESWTFDFDKDVTLLYLVIAAMNDDNEQVQLSVAGGTNTSFTRTDLNMAAVTYGTTSTARYVYTLPGGGESITAGTDITLTATNGQWGLQAVVVEYTPPPPPDPDPFDPNPDGGIEPAAADRPRSGPERDHIHRRRHGDRRHQRLPGPDRKRGRRAD